MPTHQLSHKPEAAKIYYKTLPSHLEVVGWVALLIEHRLHIISARVNGCLKHSVLVSTMHQHLTLWRQQQQMWQQQSDVAAAVRSDGVWFDADKA
jgi:hypothetical protein